jgi:alcohol dehydrogenase class IV
LHLQSLSELERLILQITDGVIDYSLSEWGVKQTEIDEIVGRSFTKSRMENNIVELSKKDIQLVFEGLL